MYENNLPVKKTGIDIKNPPTAQTLVTADFWRYLLVLKIKITFETSHL